MRRGDRARAVEALGSLMDETTALFRRLAIVAEQAHRQGSLSGGRRGVLRSLDRLGPQTVPQMARARPVSRQHMQSHVDDLMVAGLVERVPNPAHKRSHLVRLTAAGKATLDAIQSREAALLEKLDLGLTPDQIRAAAEVLRTVRERFESDDWLELVRATDRDGGAIPDR